MTVPSRQTYSIDEIKLMLVAQVEAVARHYALCLRSAYVDGHQYWTLNPGRGNRSVGSFVVHISGAKCGRWNDYATGEHGDLIDLIALALGCDARGALREARSWLGLETDSPEDIARRKAAAEAHALTAGLLVSC